MKRRNFKKGDFVHIFNRGNRKASIVFEKADKWRFLKVLRYFNDEYSLDNIIQYVEDKVKLGKCNRFERPDNWPEYKPLVKIVSYCLMPNHYHLLLKQIDDDGISKFMQKLGIGFTRYINTKYDEVGSLFQGTYKSKIIKDEKYLQYVDMYVQVFNPFELYSGGIKKAIDNFDKAFEFVLSSPFNSLGESFNKRTLNIIDRDMLGETFKNSQEYKELAKKAIVYRDLKEGIEEYIFNAD